MIITCPSCQKKFELNDNLVPESGRTLQCGSCNHKWFFEKKNETKQLLHLFLFSSHSLSIL